MESYSVRKVSGEGWIDMAPGIRRQNLVCGEKALLCRFFLEKDAVLPLHSHPCEQTGYLLAGRLLFTIAGDSIEVGPGDSWTIAAGVEHGAEVKEDATLVELFAPPRKDFLGQP